MGDHHFEGPLSGRLWSIMVVFQVGSASPPNGSGLGCEPLPVAERIRDARGEDLSALRDIERAAGQRFRDFGLDAVAEDEPASIKELQDYAAAGRAWVAVGDAGEPVG